MPRTQSRAQSQQSAAVSSQRGHLATLRAELLAFLDAHGKDVIRVDERSICRVKNVTARRITKPLFSEVVEVLVVQAPTLPHDKIMLAAYGAQVLRESVDIVSWKGNVVANSEPEAKRLKRDDEEIRRGGPGLVDAATLAMVEEYGAAVGTRKPPTQASQKLPARKPAKPPQAPPQAPPLPPPLPPSLPSPPHPSSVSASSPLPREPKPLSSVSKKEAIAILDAIAGHLVEHPGESDPLTACLSILERCWPTR